MFGLELRKKGSTRHLFNDVDNVLDQFGIPSGEINALVQIQTTAHSLQKKLTKDDHFSVCTIRECSELCNLCISQERMSVYSAAHCLHYNQMTEDYRKMLTAMVLDDFRSVLNIE